MNCPSCQTANPENARFCMNCGASLSLGGAPPAGAPPARLNLDPYLPRELQTKLQAARQRGSMLGERRVITMLFCDVKGSTAAAEKIDPELWSEVMNGIFERMIRPVYKYEGLVPRLMGDAILAFFGAPIAHEDDPRRAVLAALEIQAGTRDYIAEMRDKYGIDFGLRVGINTGLVIVGEIGSDLRMEYTAIGDAINLAARMEQTAQPGTVQVSEETYKLVAPFFEVEPISGIEVKGKAEPVKAWRVLGVKDVPGQLRGLEGLLSPLVGREAQLDLLAQNLNGLKGGRGAFIAVVGEAGLGKSSLIAATQGSEAASGLNWCRGDSLSYTRSISYYPWRQLIRQSIGSSEVDAPAEVRRKLNYVCDCCKLPGGDTPFLEAMLAVESQSSLQEVMKYQGEALIERMTEAVGGYLCGLAQESPLVLVLDDLHWADEASLNLLQNLAELANQQSILYLCLLRPDPDTPAWKLIQKVQSTLSERYRNLALQPLAGDQSASLLTNLLGHNPLPDPLKQQIIEKAQGNPFFVEELIRSLIETGQLVRADGGWRTNSSEARLELPNTLRSVLSARIDRLPETAREALQSAAVIGRTFDLALLERLTRLNGSLADAIQSLQTYGMIEPQPEGFAFRHILIQEAAYESILLKRRAELHLQIATTLEERYADRLDEFAPVLARHFYAAHDPRSLKYDRLAGEKAARLYANADAAVHFRRALEVAKAEPEAAGQISDLYSQLGSALELNGSYDQALRNYTEMQADGRARGDQARELLALMSKATIYNTFTAVHNSELGEQALKEALELSRATGDIATQARLNWNLMLNYLFSGRLDPGLEVGKVALDLARRSGNREYLAFVLNDLCRLYTCRGEFEDAYRVINEARPLWRELDNQVMLADSLGSEAEARFNAGEHAGSLKLLHQALEITGKIENLWGQSYDHMLIAFNHFETGNLGIGIRHAEKCVALGGKAGLIASNSIRAELGWIYAYCGAFERAYAVVEESIRIAAERQPDWIAFPKAARVRIHLLEGDIESAAQTRGKDLLEPISVPYVRYAIFLGLANIELAVAQKEYQSALTLSEALLNLANPLTRSDIPEALRWKARALSGLQRWPEAGQALLEAHRLAGAAGANLHLWPILLDLAQVHEKLGKPEEAETNRSQARPIVAQVADSLQEVGLRETFLNQPRVRSLIGG